MIDSARFRARMEALGLTHSELARRVGVKQPSITRLATGEQSGSRHLHVIARELKTTPEFLSGKTDDPSEGYVPPPTSEAVAADLDLVAVREVDLALGMGATFLDTPVTARFQHFPRSWIRNFTNSPPEDLFFAHAIGDSMTPTMLSGDIVLIDRKQCIVDHADLIWAFTFGGMGMIKRIGAARNGQIMILSDNPAIPTNFATPDELHIIGRVVAIVRKM